MTIYLPLTAKVYPDKLTVKLYPRSRSGSILAGVQSMKTAKRTKDQEGFFHVADAGTNQPLSFKPLGCDDELACSLLVGKPRVTSEGEGNIRRVCISSAAPCFDSAHVLPPLENTTAMNTLAGTQDQSSVIVFLKHPAPASIICNEGFGIFVTTGLASCPEPPLS